MKKILKFLLILIPWFIGGIIFKTDVPFYKYLNKPSFAPNPIIFAIVWPILYILISISIYIIYKNNNHKDISEYNKALLVNYFSNQVFSFFFFTIKSPFLALIDTFIIFITSLFMYYESKKIDRKSYKFLIPYVIWNIFALILITSVFFLNL